MRVSSGFVTGCEQERAAPLPGLAQEIADVIGRSPTLFLIWSLPRSGSRTWRVCLYVPKTMKVDHPLVRTLGFRLAERLRRHFGGEILQPSNCRYLDRVWRRSSIRHLSSEGMDAAEIGAYHGISAYRVREVLRDNPPDDTQPEWEWVSIPSYNLLSAGVESRGHGICGNRIVLVPRGKPPEELRRWLREAGEL